MRFLCEIEVSETANYYLGESFSRLKLRNVCIVRWMGMSMMEMNVSM